MFQLVMSIWTKHVCLKLSMYVSVDYVYLTKHVCLKFRASILKPSKPCFKFDMYIGSSVSVFEASINNPSAPQNNLFFKIKSSKAFEEDGRMHSCINIMSSFVWNFLFSLGSCDIEAQEKSKAKDKCSLVHNITVLLEFVRPNKHSSPQSKITIHWVPIEGRLSEFLWI